MTATVTTVTAAVISVGVIAAVTVLTWHGSIDGQAAIGVLGTVIGAAGTGTAVHAGVKAGVAATQAGTTDAKGE